MQQFLQTNHGTVTFILLVFGNTDHLLKKLKIFFSLIESFGICSDVLKKCPFFEKWRDTFVTKCNLYTLSSVFYYDCFYNGRMNYGISELIHFQKSPFCLAIEEVEGGALQSLFYLKCVFGI